MKKKNKIRVCPLILMGFILIAINSCKKDQIPVVITADVISISQNSATCGGTIISDGGKNVTTSGICWSTGQIPTINDNKTTDGAGKGSFTSSMTGLTSKTTYYVRAYATNKAGTEYGNTASFTTLPDFTGTVTDYDGNVYHTITIGTQVWMVENLNVIHYRNGDPIPNIADSAEWAGLSTGACCNFENSFTNGAIYGKLYNWYAANESRNIAPVGWHVATDVEWTTLLDYLGGADVAGGKLKETGTTHWQSPNIGATNFSGFTALPAGWRSVMNGWFGDIGFTGDWWVCSIIPTHYYINNNISAVWGGVGGYETAGSSVRCVKDN